MLMKKPTDSYNFEGKRNPISTMALRGAAIAGACIGRQEPPHYSFHLLYFSGYDPIISLPFLPKDSHLFLTINLYLRIRFGQYRRQLQIL
ncbi:hypothetical protein HRI_004635400 [Hibiscus trionum]|uniref:Uncharacterized protein n=1 Tax=Hibiscus trionum TaxID=183268 RepID=A0A9W7JAK8_HIBTR|nr:hypothetical protein HRI_004635400 [Hibiscus trionum]